MGADTRHALCVSALPAGMWWYMMRASVRVSWSIPISPTETPWSRFTGRPASPRVHRVLGCLAFYRVVKPDSKAHMRARRALHLGMAEDQPGYYLLDLDSRTTVVTPHVRFVEDIFPSIFIFPGLNSAPRGEEPATHDMERLFNTDANLHSNELDPAHPQEADDDDAPKSVAPEGPCYWLLLLLPGFEPRMSRPQREVLTTILQ